MAIRIYIDQGHNPENPNAGAEGNGLREQDITYRVGKALGDLLRTDGNFEVRESRPTPETTLGTSNTTSLQARVQDANRWGADYFISLHTNSAANAAASGSEAFSYAPDTAGYRLGSDILTAMTNATGLRNRGMKVRPGLYVLRRTRMPAVLVEMGFITNPGDAALMDQNPGLFARGIYNGILTYLGR